MRAAPSLHIIAATIAISLVAATPPAAAGVDFFGIHVGSHGFGVSLGLSDWTVYGDAWANSHWSLDYQVMLSGYGEWVWVSGLGRVWRPFVAVGWQPFTHGRWVHTSFGWTWVAYEPWGYFPHHYGHWAMSTYGWVWQPGYTYSPASVVWVNSGGHVGWYARPPRGWSHAHRGFHHGYDHGYHSGYGDGYRDGWRDARYATFVSWRHMTADNVSRHAVAYRAVERRGARNGIQALPAPPSRSQVRARTGRAVPEAQLEERTIQSGDRRVTLARPVGVDRSVQDNARSTVHRALAPDVSRRVEAAQRQGVTGRGTSASRTGATGITKPGRSTQTAPATITRSGASRTPSQSTRASGQHDGAPFPTTRRSSPASAQRQTSSASRQTAAASSSSPTVRGDRREASAATRPGRSSDKAREAARSTPERRQKKPDSSSSRPRRR